MFDNIFFYFLLASIGFTVLTAIFFAVQKNVIKNNYRQHNSLELKNISGTMVTESGWLRKKIQWCSFDILINKNSIFLFPKNLYILPAKTINLIYSKSDTKYTKVPSMLRELKVNKNSVEFTYYPEYVMLGKRKIYLKNLNQDQISIFEDIKQNKNY